jgi:hypothetical protein
MKADQELKYCESILIDKLIIKNLVRARPRESPLSRGWKWQTALQSEKGPENHRKEVADRPEIDDSF